MGSLWSKPGSCYQLKQEEREIIDDVDALLINGFDWSVYKQQIDKWKTLKLNIALVGSSQSGKSMFINSVIG